MARWHNARVPHQAQHALLRRGFELYCSHGRFENANTPHTPFGRRSKSCCLNTCGRRRIYECVASSTRRVRTFTPVTAANIGKLVASCEIDHSVRPSPVFAVERPSEKALGKFLRKKLHRYASERNEPSADATSGLSPYFHFGHISSLEVALAVRDYAREHKLMADEFLEELIVRRELAFNFARFTENLESLDACPIGRRDAPNMLATNAIPSIRANS